MARLVFRSLIVFLILTGYSVSAHTRSQNQPGSAAGSLSGYTLLLVDANSNAELADARDFIIAQGGRVSVVVPPRAILGWIPPALDSSLLGHHGIRSISRSPVGSVPRC